MLVLWQTLKGACTTGIRSGGQDRSDNGRYRGKQQLRLNCRWIDDVLSRIDTIFPLPIY